MPSVSKPSRHYLLTKHAARYPTRNPTDTFLIQRILYALKPQGLALTTFASIARPLSFNIRGLAPATYMKQTANVVQFFQPLIFTWRAIIVRFPKSGVVRVISNFGVKMCGFCPSIDHARLAIGFSLSSWSPQVPSSCLTASQTGLRGNMR